MKQLFHIDNPGDNSLPQILSLRLGEKYASFSISNKSATELFALAYCTAEEWTESEMHDFFAAYPVLQHSFYQVLVAYDFIESSFIPVQDYRHEEAGTVLSNLFGKATAAITIAEPVPEWQLYNIFGLPKEINEWVNRNFPSAKCWHQYSVGLRGIDAANENGSLLVDIRKEDFTVLVTKRGKFLLAQTYEYATPEDVLYYLVRIAAQFSLSREECAVQLSGLVDQQSALYKELYQYFTQFTFRDATWNSGEYPAHFFTSLNDLARCAS